MGRVARAARLAFVVGSLAVLAAGSGREPAGAAPPPPPTTLESGWAVEGFIDPAFGAQSTQFVFDANDGGVSIFGAHTTDLSPYRLRWSRLSGLSSWSPSDTLFAPTVASELLPQASRAADGTIWLAWLRDSNGLGTQFAGPALVTSRLVGSTWSLPETVAVGLPLVDPQAPRIEFTILGVSAESAWVAWDAPPDGDPFSLDRDLFYAVRSAAGWSPPGPLATTGLAETNPVLVRTTSGGPAALFRFSNAPSVLNGSRWNGATWVSNVTDQFAATGIYGYDAAPDTNGAVRIMAFVRETDVNGLGDHVRELVWNDAGFHEGTSVASFPVVSGAENDPPAWSGISMAVGRECPACVGPTNDREFRTLWLDFTQDLQASVFSVLRTQSRFEPLELVGRSFELQQGWPKSAQDLATDRWYAVWNAPPSAGGLRRAKFTFSQTFAGDLDMGANFIAPDTVRVTIVCTGDATGRTFRLYRLKVDAGLPDPALPPPVPAEAVPLPGNPYAGRCPFDVDDFPGPGRWFYYGVLEQQGTFPERDARTLQAAVVPDTTGGGGPGDVTRSVLLAPRPQPAHGPVSLPYDLLHDADVSILIRDLRGRLVRVLVLGPRAAGAYRGYNAPVWDGLDRFGHVARPGMYFATLAVGGRASGPGQRIVYFP